MRSNVKKIEPYFDLHLIRNDIDDNKFVNCAFAGNVHFLVSNDKHFNILKITPFPKIPLLSSKPYRYPRLSPSRWALYAMWRKYIQHQNI